MNLRTASLAIWVLAFAVRVTLIFGLHRQELGRPEPVRIAVALARTGSFADPYAISTGPTAHAAPLYPAMLAPIYVIFGDTRRADLARLTFSAAGAALEYALLPTVAVSLGLPASAGMLAAVAGSIFPLHYWPECMGEFEVTWVAICLEISVMMFAAFMTRPSVTARSAMYAGLWCGLGLLLTPALLLPLAAFLAIALWRFRTRLLAWTAALSVTTVLVIAPWIARDYVLLGGFSFIRDDFGLELHVSNNDDAMPGEEQNIGTPFFHREHPFASSAAASRLKQEGELAFEREHVRNAIEWIERHPSNFLRLTFARAVNFWFPPLAHPLHRYPLWGLIVTGWAGLVYLSRTNSFAALVLGSILVSFPLVYYLVHNYLRYQHPVYWAVLLLAACAVNAAFCLWRSTADRGRIRRSADSARCTTPGRAG